MLEKELKYYYQVRDELRAKNPDGGFVVIKDETILGIWLNRTDALKEGINTYGNVSFLVKDINDNPSNKINFSRNIKFNHVISHC